MTIDYLANLAEITSGIIVVITLIFLVIQIRDNTKALRANAIENYYNGYLEVTADANRIPDLAVASQKAFTGEVMDHSDNNHFATWIQRTCSVLERGLVMVKEGVLDQETFDLGLPPAKMLLTTPAGRHWYFFLKEQRGLFRPELHTLVEKFFEEQDRQVAVEMAAPSPSAKDDNPNGNADIQKIS